MGDLIQDLKYGIRVLAKNRGFTVVAVLTLALGIGANTAIFTIINAVLLNPLPVEQPSRLVGVFTRDTRTIATSNFFALTPVSLLNYQDFREQNSVLADMAAEFDFALTLSGQSEPAQLNATLTTANYFDVLGVKAARGRMFLPEEDRLTASPVVVVSYSLWTQRFGADPALVGRTLTLNGRPFTVVGVAPPNFKGTFSLAPPEVVWVPMGTRNQVLTGFAAAAPTDRRFRLFNVIGRLKAGVSPSQAEADLKTIAAALEKRYPKENQGRTVSVALLSDAVLGINQRGQFVLAGGVMMSVVGLVLLIACVNLANLLLAQAAKHEKEMTLRAALGANRARLTLVGVATGLTVSLAASRLVASLLFGVQPLDPVTFVLVPVILISVALFASYIPARRATKVDPMVALRYE